MVRPRDIYERAWAPLVPPRFTSVREWLKYQVESAGYEVVGFRPPKRGEDFVKIPTDGSLVGDPRFPKTPRFILQKKTPR